MSNYCNKGHWENGMKLPCKQCEIESLRQQLAECQATNGKLRDEFDGLIYHCELSNDCQYGTLGTSYVRQVCEQALALPNDATALNELIAEHTKERVSGFSGGRRVVQSNK